jgi:uncharacterized protein YoxC
MTEAIIIAISIIIVAVSFFAGFFLLVKEIKIISDSAEASRKSTAEASKAILKSAEVIDSLSLKINQQNQTMQELREKLGDIKTAIPALTGLEEGIKKVGSQLSEFRSALPSSTGIEEITRRMTDSLGYTIGGKISELKDALPAFALVENVMKDNTDTFVKLFGAKIDELASEVKDINLLTNKSINDISEEIKLGSRHLSSVTENLNKTLENLNKPIKDSLDHLSHIIQEDVLPIDSSED